MATDATGTPTSLGIPRYDVTNDAPSGLGFNAAMQSIDDLISDLQNEAILSGSIAGITVGSVPVWDGSQWVKPSGTPDGTKFLRDDGTWAAPTAAAWTSWSPTKITQDASNTTNVTHTVNYGKYFQNGKFTFLSLKVTFSAAGTAGQTIIVQGAPTPAASVSVGVAIYNDIGTAIISLLASVNTSGIQFTLPGSSSAFGTSTTIANNDTLQLSVTYEAA